MKIDQQATQEAIIVDRTRTSLTWLWVAGFVISIFGFIYLDWHVGIGPDSRSQLFESIVNQYAPLLGAVLGFHFAIRAKGKKEKSLASRTPLFVAIAMSTLWNLLAVGFVVRACLDPDKTPDAISGIGSLVPKLSWIVAPAMGFFFGKSPGGGK
jgi:hypothetical protein